MAGCSSRQMGGRSKRARRSGKGSGLFSRLYSPVGHALMFGKNSVNTVGNTAKGVGSLGFGGINRIGRSFSGHLNNTFRNVFTRKNRKNRKNRKSSRRN